MKIVKISTASSLAKLFKRQTPDSSLVWGDYEFHINDEITEGDYWIVQDEMANQQETFRCPKSNVFLFTGEPPFVKYYTKRYLKQFSKVFTCQKNILKRANSVKRPPLLPWFAGASQWTDGKSGWDDVNYLDYAHFKNEHPIKENDRIAVITSNKRYTKGHIERLEFVEKISAAFPGQIDIYGNGFNPIGDKYPVLSKYKYMIVIENCRYESYWTEKLADAYLCECFPLYIGAPDISDYFDENGLLAIDIKDVDASMAKIKYALDNHLFESNYDKLLLCKDRVLEVYNMFPEIVNAIRLYGDKSETQKQEITLKGLIDIEWKITMLLRSKFPKLVDVI